MASKAASRTNVLLTLGVLFTIGAASRLVPSNVAAASDGGALGTGLSSSTIAAAAATPEHAPVKSKITDITGQICFSEDLAETMAADQLRLQTKNNQLSERELELQAWSTELEQTREDLSALQATLDARWQDMQAFASEDLKHLAQMYGAMKPDQAATIFNQMDPGFAAGFLRLLSSEQAGLIMANMESQQAYIVSVRLASINEDLRREDS
jgi:flagellar motility protein MotE (MotC chaperone)